MFADVLPDCADRLADGTFTAVWAQIQRAGGCSRPIRLSGFVDQVDRATGEIRRTVDSAGLPDGTILVPCGNRRASVCPSCSYLYAGDAWQIVHSGVARRTGHPRHRRAPSWPVRHGHRAQLRGGALPSGQPRSRPAVQRPAGPLPARPAPRLPPGPPRRRPDPRRAAVRRLPRHRRPGRVGTGTPPGCGNAPST